MDLIGQLFQESTRFELFVKSPKARRSMRLARNNGESGRLDSGHRSCGLSIVVDKVKSE